MLTALILGYIASAFICAVLYGKEANTYRSIATWGYTITRTLISLTPILNTLIVIASVIAIVCLNWDEPVFKD